MDTPITHARPFFGSNPRNVAFLLKENGTQNVYISTVTFHLMGVFSCYLKLQVPYADFLESSRIATEFHLSSEKKNILRDFLGKPD